MTHIGRWKVYQFVSGPRGGITTVENWEVFQFEEDGNVKSSYYFNHKWHTDEVKRYWLQESEKLHYYFGPKEPATINLISDSELTITIHTKDLVLYCKRI